MKRAVAKRISWIFIVVTVFICIVAVLSCMYLYSTGDTTTDYRFGYKMADVQEEYEDFKNLVDLEKSFAIPGLARTNVTAMAAIDENNGIIRYEKASGRSARYMIPQGLCFAENYIVISAYDGRGIYNSVLYILDRESGQYLTTVLLQDKNHVGGIAYDGALLWIAKSGDNALSCISCERLKKAVSLGEDCVGVTYDETFNISCRASFVTYYDGLLWVGVFEKNSDSVSVLRGFAYEESRGVMGLFQQDELFLPQLANGAAIQDINGHVCLIVDSSYGRNNASKIHTYELHMEENNFENAVCILKDEYEFPPMVEEVEFIDGQVYFIFESAATKYSMNRVNRCKYPVDRVCAVQQEKLLAWTQDSYVKDETILETEEDQIADDLSYHVSTTLEAKSVPTYVKINGKQGVQMLYNPYTAKMLFSILQDTNQLSAGNVVGTYSWNDTLSKNGYSNLQAFRHDTLNLDSDAVAAVDIVAGITRKSSYNGVEKFNIVVGIKTTEEEVLRQALLQADLFYRDGVADKFLENASRLYERLLQLTFDVPEFKETGDGYIIQYRSIQFADIIDEMKDSKSRYTLTVTGKGMGGSIAGLLTGIILPEQGIYEGNVNCYTFGALAVVKENEYEGTNIFNIVNSDDQVCEFQGNTLWGDIISYQADEGFTARYYGERRMPYFADTAHSMMLYEGILDKIEMNIIRYALYNTESPGTFYGVVTISRDCFANFQNLIARGTLIVESDTCLFIRRNLRAMTFKVNGEVKVHGLLYAKYVKIDNGIVSVDGDCMIAVRQNGSEGYLEISGDQSRLEIYGKMTIPNFRYTAKTEQHIYWYGKKTMQTTVPE